MKNLLIISFLLLLGGYGFGQSSYPTIEQYNNSGANKLMFAKDTKEAEQLAKMDIAKGVPFLHLCSGEGAVEVTSDSLFQAWYSVYFYEHGCMCPDKKLVKAYNFIILNYLYQGYEHGFISDMRNDVIGLKGWNRRSDSSHYKLK